ncbi:MAG: polysaccharide deacetylase family protein [Leptolyngbyaceae cyanobacterium]
MPPLQKAAFLMMISMVFFLLGNRVNFVAAPHPVAARHHPFLTTPSNIPLADVQAWFAKVPIRLNPPIQDGWDLDAEFIQTWLSDRSPEIFLTFDDGPSPKATGLILDILQEHDIKATFFVLGRNVARFPELAQRIVAEGHELALHSQTHADMLTLTREQKEAEIATSLSLLHWYFPEVRIRWFRPPYGHYDQEVVDIAHEYGLCLAMFNEISADHRSSIDDYAQVVLNGWGKIIVFHDGQWPRQTPLTEAEARLIEGLKVSIGSVKTQGAQFMTLSSQFGEFCP